MTMRQRLSGWMPKRFSTRLFAAFTSTAVVVCSVLMWSIYFSARNDLLDSERRLSQELLNQVRYNLTTLDEMNRNLCFMVLGSNEAQVLLHTAQPDGYALMLLRNRLSDSLRSNPFVHSVYLYNRARDVYYSTHKSFHYVDADFLEQVESGALVPNLKPLVRELDGDVVITYGLGELFGSTQSDVAIYLNVHLDYLIDNLEAFTGGQLLVFDQGGKMVNRFASKMRVPEALVAALLRDMPEAVSADQAQIELVRAENQPLQAVTLLRLPELDWTLAKITPYGDAFSRTERLRITIITVNLISLLVILVLYALISRRLYTPIRRMISQVAGGGADKQPPKNEFEYLTGLYSAMAGELSQLKQERVSREDFLRLFENVSGIDSRTLEKQRVQAESATKDERSRAEALAEAIRAEVEARYQNPALGAGVIADALGVSSAHAGRVFKQQTGMSIPEHINQVRLTKAALWLRNTDQTVGEIMTRVGYTNESYFFKLFKERFGDTPRNYAADGREPAASPQSSQLSQQRKDDRVP